MKKVAILFLSVLLLGSYFTACGSQDDDKEPSDAEAEVLAGIFDTVFGAMDGEFFTGIDVSPGIPPSDPAEMIGNTYTVTATDYSPDGVATVNGHVALTPLAYADGELKLSMEGEIGGGPYEGEMYTISCDGAVLFLNVGTGEARDGSGDIVVNGETYDLGAVIDKIESLQ